MRFVRKPAGRLAIAPRWKCSYGRISSIDPVRISREEDRFRVTTRANYGLARARPFITADNTRSRACVSSARAADIFSLVLPIRSRFFPDRSYFVDRARSPTHLIVHVIPIAHVVACAGAGLNVPPHVELDLLAAHASARRHHRVPHAIAAGAIHPRVALIQVTPTGVVVAEAAGAPGIRGVSHPGLRTLLVAQSRLGPVEGRGYILKEENLVCILESRPRSFSACL